MTRIKTTVLMLAVIAASDLSTAKAQEPVHIRSVLDLTLPQPALSAFCGFTVVRHIVGLAEVRLFMNAEGSPVYEIDTSTNWRNTYVSPDTGKSVSYPGTGSVTSVYSPDGKAVVAVEGLMTLVHLPGREPLLIDLGRFIFSAEVVGIDANRVPLTGPPVEVLFDSTATRGAVLAACEALAPDPAAPPARAIRVIWIPER